MKKNTATVYHGNDWRSVSIHLHYAFCTRTIGVDLKLLRVQRMGEGSLSGDVQKSCASLSLLKFYPND